MKARIVLLAKASNVGLARNWVEDNCRQFGVKGRKINDLKTITSEVVTNVVKHAYHGRLKRRFILKVKIRANKLSIIVRDFGSGFNTSRTQTLHVGLRIVDSLSNKVKIRTFGFGCQVRAIIYLKDFEFNNAFIHRFKLINHRS